MSLELPFGYKTLVPLSNIDERYGIYNSYEEALESTIGVRELGFTVGILIDGNVVEYWFKSGIEDSDLVEKLPQSQILENITSSGVGNLGGINEGDIISEGTNLTDFVKKLLQKQVPPTYTTPSANLLISPSGNIEVGDTKDFTLTPSYIQNDGGNLFEVIFKRNGTTIHTQNNLNVYVDLGRIISAGTNNYSVEIYYNEGDIKNDNFGEPYPDGQILSGSTINTKTYSGVYYNWYGTYGVVQPTTGANIRTLLNFTTNSSFTINTGSDNTVHIIAIPSTKNLSSVVDQDALNVNITSNYILSGTITTIPDAGGNPVSYKVYILTLAIPYTSNHRHNIIIN